MADSNSFFCIVLIIAFISIVISIFIQRNKEGETIFSGHISDTRAKFLMDVFGLSIDELKLLHFDGCLFHLKENDHKSYKEFTSVSIIQANKVQVANSALPHRKTWSYMRSNGMPDRRLYFNPEIMTSLRLVLQFNGKSSCRLTTYAHPTIQKTESTVKNLNTLLNIASVIDLETRFNEYEVQFNKVKLNQTLLEKSNKNKSELELVLEATKRLDIQSVATENIIKKKEELTKELNDINLQIAALQKETASAKDIMNFIVQSIRLEISRVGALKIV